MANRALNRRKQNIWDLFDFTVGAGLEIGPLHDPVVARPGVDVQYLDVFDRDTLLETYADNAIVNKDLIPDIDIVLTDNGRVRSIAEAAGDARFDWVMASHVIEHVPDLIGWLDQIATITTDGAALVLAVPDRRYCFDLHRPGTSLGQVLQAHELGEMVPSVRAVYDHNRNLTPVRPEEIWAGQRVGYERRTHTLEAVQAKVARARSGDYVDSHVWLFTPGAFLEQIIELRTLGLSEWRVEQFQTTRSNSHEFYAVLRRLPRGGWDADLIADEPPAGAMPDWILAEHETSTRLADAERQLASRDAELAKLRRRVAVLTTREQGRLGYRVKRVARTLPGFVMARRVRRRWAAIVDGLRPRT